MTKKPKAKKSTKAELSKEILKAQYGQLEKEEIARLTPMPIPSAQAIEKAFNAVESANGTYCDMIRVCITRGTKGIEVLAQGGALIVENRVKSSPRLIGLKGDDLTDAKEQVKGKLLTSLNSQVQKISKEIFGAESKKVLGVSRTKYVLGKSKKVVISARKFTKAPSTPDTKKAPNTTDAKPVDLREETLQNAARLCGNIKSANALVARRTYLKALCTRLNIGGVDITKMYLLDEDGKPLSKAS